MRGILLLLLMGAVFTDLVRGKIYNVLVFPAAAAGILLRLESGGRYAVPGLLISMALPGLLIPFWLCGRGIAAGDIKLLFAISCLTAPAVFLPCLILSFVAGAILAILVWIAGKDRKASIPMAVPIAAGTGIVVLGTGGGLV